MLELHKKISLLIINYTEQSIVKITAFFWLIAKIWSYKLWLNNRLFPLVPATNFFLNDAAWLHQSLFACSLLILSIVLFFNSSKKVLLLLIFVELSSCILDQNRWQPWEYVYLVVTILYILYSRQKAVLVNKITLLLFSIYFISGIQKINECFLDQIWGTMFLKSFLHFPESLVLNKTINYAGLLLPIIETLSAIALLFKKTSKNAIISLLIMHIFILLFIGPLGLKYNKIVWPWNVAMMLYLYIILLNNRHNYLNQLFVKRNIVFIFWWLVLPSLNFINLWDNYLSFSLYSGKIPQMSICILDTTKTKELSKFYSNTNKPNTCMGSTKIFLQNWAFKEMNTPPYPEKRIYKSIAAQLSKKYTTTGFSFTIFENALDKTGIKF